MGKKYLSKMVKDVLDEVNASDVLSPFFVKIIDGVFKKVKGPAKKIHTRPTSFKFGAAYGDLTTYSKSDLEVKVEITIMMGASSKSPVPETLAIVDISRADFKGKQSKEFKYSFAVDEKTQIDEIVKYIQQYID